MQLLDIFFRGIALAYQMVLDSASDGNLNTRNPKEAVRLIERRKSATTLGKEQMDDVKAKLDSVHKLLKKQASFAKDVEAVDVDNDRY